MVTSSLQNKDRAALTETSQFALNCLKNKNIKNTTKRLANILAACTAGGVFQLQPPFLDSCHVMLVCLADNCFLKRLLARNQTDRLSSKN